MHNVISPTPAASGTPTKSRRRRWAFGVTVTVLGLVAALLTTTVPANGLNPNLTGARNRIGFPGFYTDNTGLSLRLCEDGSARCLLNTRAAPGLADSTNGEAFYWLATSTLRTSRGTLDVELALEAAYVAPRVPTVFTRLRVRGHLNRAGSYVLAHPYGRVRISAASPSQQRNVNFTRDLTCPRGPGRCPGITNFLHAASPGTGYVGFGDIPTRVTGGTSRNILALRAPSGAVIGRTGRFAVLGRVAGGAANLLSTGALHFGNTARTRSRSLVMRNIGARALSLSRMRVAGTTRVTVARSGCALRRSLPVRGACRVTVVYHPGAARRISGALTFSDNTRIRTHRIPLSAATAAITTAVRTSAFAARRIRTESRTHRILVHNVGVRPMRIHRVRLNGANPRSFERRRGADRCVRGAVVRPRTTCSVYVGFTPRARGLLTARVSVLSNALNSPRSIQLRGRGR